MKWYKNKKGNFLKVPDGWYVSMSYQNIENKLWNLTITNIEDIKNDVEPRFYNVFDKLTFQEALKECINKLE